MDTQAKVIVVGDQRLADILARCGAEWLVYPAAATVTAMWDAIDNQTLPSIVTAIIVTDGTAENIDELELTLAAFAPFATTFVVSDPVRGQQLVSRARQLAPTVDGGNPDAPIYVLPSNDLAASLGLLQQILKDKVGWNTQKPAQVAPAAPVAPPVAPTPPVAPPTQYSVPSPIATPPAAPVYVAPDASPIITAPPILPPVASIPRDYEQAAVYSREVTSQASQHLSKLPNAIEGQVTIACMSSKGGSGKSTTALCLAGTIAKSTAAAGAPKKVVVVDLDTRDGQLGSLIGQYMPTAVSIRVMPVLDANTVQQNLVHDKRMNIDALLAPVRPRNADDVGPDFYRKVIQILQTTHDVVILDCSVNYLDPLLGVGFALADEILFVTTLATTSVEGMARALTELFAPPSAGGLGLDRNKVGIVANQVILNVNMGREKLLRAALGAPLIGQIPAEYDTVLMATNQNKMSDLLKHYRLGPAYLNLAKMCLPNWQLASIVTDTQAPATNSGEEEESSGKRGLFRRG